MGPDGPPGIVDMGAVPFRRPVARRCGARGRGQERRSVVRGPRFPRGRPVTGENKPEPHVGVRVLGRIGARRRPLRGQRSLRCFYLFVYSLVWF